MAGKLCAELARGVCEKLSFTEDEKNYVMTVSKKEAREYNEGGIIAYMELELINETVSRLHMKREIRGMDLRETKCVRLNGKATQRNGGFDPILLFAEWAVLALMVR